MYIASCKGRTKVVEKLVSVGADINKQTQVCVYFFVLLMLLLFFSIPPLFLAFFFFD